MPAALSCCASLLLPGLPLLALLIAPSGPGPAEAQAAVASPESQVVVPNTEDHPRNGEGDIIELKNGDLLLAYGRWNRDGTDFGAAEIWCKTSHDRGKTWGEDRCLIPNEGKVTTFEVGFLRLQSGEILMCYCVKDSTEDCSICFRKSADEGQTWSQRVKYQIPKPYTGYTGINNDRLIQLKSGRILLAAFDGWVRGTVIVSFVLYSDDNGQTWQKGGDVDIRDIAPDNKYGADEPAVVELKDGRVMMIVRTDLGIIARAYSSDGGVTWTKPEAIPGLVAPNSPASIARIPQTGDLLLIWNNNKQARNPLNSAISRDEGQAWENIRIVDRGGATFCYTSITPVDDRILLTYYGRGGLVLKAFHYRWFYQPEDLRTSWMYEGNPHELAGWRLTQGDCVYIQDMPEVWDGSKDMEIEASILLRSPLPDRRATAMLWIGDQAPGMSCALYLRAGADGDAVSFSETMEPTYQLGDAGKLHTYRIVTDHAQKMATLFVDGATEPALSTPLGAVLGRYDINRILYGDPNVDFLGGESELLRITWKTR